MFLTAECRWPVEGHSQKKAALLSGGTALNKIDSVLSTGAGRINNKIKLPFNHFKESYKVHLTTFLNLNIEVKQYNFCSLS